MFLDDLRHGRIFCALLFVALTACGGGGGDGDGGGDTTFNCDGSGAVRISGSIEYEFVPAVPANGGARLDFDDSELRPLRQTQVQAICPDGSSIYASTFTNDAGEYGLDVPENVDVAIRVRALMQESGDDGAPSWDVSVVDNTNGQGVWSAQGEAFDSATGSATVDIELPSGWSGSSFSGARAAGPFAILDSVYTAMLRVIGADADVGFPALKLNWSPDNRACNGTAPYANGCIGTSFFTRSGSNRNIYILGDAANDTDEYDNHVIIHEWGHYYEDALSRSDSIGGAHGGGDALDPRVAFGEGWGNAWSAIATDDPLYVDTFGTGTNGFFMNLENGGGVVNPGWWNETSVQEIIYDLYDAASDGNDTLALTFAPLHAVLTDQQRDTEATTTVFSLLHFLKQTTANDAAIDDLALDHGISIVGNEWGDNRGGTDDGSEFGVNASEYVVDAGNDVHSNLGELTDGDAVLICTHSGVGTSSSSYNRLGVRRFLRFQVPAAGSWNINVAGGTDPDFYVLMNNAESEYMIVGESENPGVENASGALAAGTTYVMEVFDYAIANDEKTGESCFNIGFTSL